MDERLRLKRALFELLDGMSADGALSDEGSAELKKLVPLLQAVSPVPDPIDRQDRVQGRWESLFADFGSRQSAGKTRVHDSDLRTHTFGQFPPVPIRATRLCQEIAAGGGAYNNVVDFEAQDGSFAGHVIVRGRYVRDPDGNLQRFVVEFHAAEVHGRTSRDTDVLREKVGWTAPGTMAKPFKPPKLHSDIVYLDDDTRINVGGYGGTYVLRRLDEAPVSVTFAS